MNETRISELKRIFVVGCKRSGTTWTTLLLAQHPAVAAFHHSKFFHYLGCLELWWKQRESKLPDSAVSKKTIYRSCREVALRVFDDVARSKPGAHAVVDKTPENLQLARFILKVFPDAYFIHVIRDPRSVFSSLRSGGESWARWEFPTKPFDGAKLWREEVEMGQRICKLTERYLEVRYEALSENGPSELEKIFAWLELPADRELCAQALAACAIDKVREKSKMPAGFFRQGEAEAWRQELSAFEVRIIEHVARGLMQELGYECVAAPFKHTPFRLRLHEGTDQVLSSLDRHFNRVSKAVLRRWRGRELDYPEIVVY